MVPVATLISISGFDFEITFVVSIFVRIDLQLYVLIGVEPPDV